MKKVIKAMAAFTVLFLFTQAQMLAQDTLSGVNRGTTAKNSANYSDTSFINHSVKQLIVEYKLADMAQQNAEHPKIKGVAREIMGNNRQALQRLLIANGSKPIAGVEQKVLDSITTASQQQQRGNDNRRQRRFTGNTATDSLGSGSTGSGNQSGEDTSMLRASKNDEKNENYSEQGEYLYDSESFQADLELAGKSKGEAFEQQFLEMMVKLQNTKITRFNQAIDASKNDKIRSAALAILPIAKLDYETLKRIIQKAPPSRSTDPNTERRFGEDRTNKRNAK